MTEAEGRKLREGDRVELLPRVGLPERASVKRVFFTEGRPGTSVLIRRDDGGVHWTEPNLLALPEVH